jgi:hypothetical protein
MAGAVGKTNKQLQNQARYASSVAAAFSSQRAGKGSAPLVTDPTIGTLQGQAIQAARQAAATVETQRQERALAALIAREQEYNRQQNIANRALAHNAQQLANVRANYGRVTAANNTFGQATQQSYSKLQLLNLALNENADNLPRIRYALYDVAFTLGIIGAAMGAATVATVAMAVEYERQFAEVRRTTGITGDAANLLQDQLIDLSQTIPISYAQITEIAALAGQLGVATTSVQAFTETTAKFAATTDVTVEAAATAFGRLDSLLGDVNGNFEALGS